MNVSTIQHNDVRGATKFQKKKYLRLNVTVNTHHHRIIIRRIIIRDNSHKLNLLLLLTKDYEMMQRIFQEIGITINLMTT